MPTDVIMPQMGESIFEGTITKWLKKAGDAVDKDEPLFEISTDKVDAEIPSPVAGVLTEIKIPEGATVEVSTVVAVIGESALSQGTASQPALSVAEGVTQTLQTNAPALQAAEKPDAEGDGGFNPRVTPIESTLALASEGRIPPISPETTTFPAASLPPEGELSNPPSAVHTVAGQSNSATPPRSSPLVRRIARDNNLDLSRIAGSGSEGRITKEDVLRHLAEHGPGSVSASPDVAAPQPPQAPQPLTKMRAIIAQRMTESVRISPHAHTVYKVDMTRIAQLRDREKSRFEQKHGVKLTYMPFIAAAAVRALVKFPIVNASLAEGLIHYHPNVNLGIAVALEWGLIVPVVRQAESLSFLSLARAIADLATRARTKKLLPNEVQGGTFTLTNSGVFGGEFGMPIINQPEAAILAIGGLRKEPVVLTDAEGNDSIAIRSVQYFCLGFDHRLIDGADSGKFMSEFKRTLEEWEEPVG
jgi:2-oxoglutarate dehydrogenase E2 component (dihydrolipoamide succinyltransferase)